MATDSFDTIVEGAIDRMIAAEEAAPEEEIAQADDQDDQAEEQEQTADDVAEVETSDDEDENADSADPEPASRYTVKVDGTEMEVTLDDLKRSYSGQAFIQKGMQEAAETKKQAAAIFETLQKQQAEFFEVVQRVQQQGVMPQPKAPDEALMETDPIGYMQAEARYRKEMSGYIAQQQQFQQMQAQQSQLQERAMWENAKAQLEVLKQRIPDFADDQKAAALKTKLIKTGAEAYGFTEAELGSIVDARQVQVLHDAAKWRELQASKAVAKKPQEAPRVVKPVGRASDPVVVKKARQFEQAKKTGRVDDFVNAALNRK